MIAEPVISHLQINHIGSQIGNTPLILFPSLSSSKVKIYGKAEWFQLGGSVKARAAYYIIRTALQSGKLQGKTLLDASSGNTAIAYASICAALNIPVEICLPKNASKRRKDILVSLGAKLHLTSEFEGTDGAQVEAKRLKDEFTDTYFYADQYNNSANWKAHYETTAQEIWAQTSKRITHFATGLGTTGSFTGTTKGLKELNGEITAVALQPNSPMHLLEGWKHLETAVVPGIFNDENLDEYRQVDSTKALEMISHVATNEGILLSPSAAANLTGAYELSQEIEEGVIVTLLPDDISKYEEVFDLINKK